MTSDMDPLVCINNRMVGEEGCGEPESRHCDGCRMCPGLGNCVCRNNTPADKHWIAAAHEAFAKHAGATSWTALTDTVSHHTADHYSDNITATVTPLLDEIRRLTASPDPAQLSSARELVDAWNRRTPDEQLALADRFLELQRYALRCAEGRCTTKENS